MGLKFEWDRRKAVSNSKKHGVSFEDAATAFGDRLSVTIHDPKHSDDEDRFSIFGRNPGQKARGGCAHRPKRYNTNHQSAPSDRP
jgi:uncharacterized DUF497 family protein